MTAGPAKPAETYPQMLRRHVDEKSAIITRAVRATGGNRAQAAQMIGMDRRSMLRAIRDLALDVPPPADRGRPRTRADG